MSESKSPSEAAKKRLTEACRTKDTSVRLAWAITIGEALLLGVAAVALMDYWLMLPVWMRLLAAGIMSVLALLGIYRLIRFFRRPTKLKEAALDVEAAKPELGCEISTAAEYLSGERQITHQYEPELVAALESKAAEDLRSAQIPYERRLLRPAVILGLTLLGLLVFLLAAPVASTALRRTALPFSKARYTQVDVMPGNLEVPVGRDVEITNRFTGRAPKDPQFHWQQTGPWQSAPLTTRSSDGAYLYSLKKLRSDVKYRVTGNDAVSETYEIQTYVPPEVKDLSVQIEYPAYTRLKPAAQKSPDITALRASTVQIQIEPSVKLAQARLRFTALTQEVVLQPTAEGSWTGSLKVTKDTDYWIELADAKGHRGGDDKPHHIKAIPDTPPTVEIEDPGQDTRSSATNRLPVKISVADDFGVEAVQLVFHKLGGQEQVVTVKAELGDKGEMTANAELDLAALGLHDYELVAYHALAKDNNTLDGPGTGKSPVYFVEITNLEGTNCPPKKGQVQKVNLLAIQKQLIADTTALPADAAAEKFQELSARQRDATDFGKIYLSTLTAAAAPAGAVSEMDSAVKEMTTAQERLTDRKRNDALPPEENALAHLYQVLKQLPELENMPTQPPPQNKLPPTNMLAVVLEAIKQKKKEEQPDPPALADALRQAQDLARSQAGVNAALRNAEQPPGNGQGQGDANSQSKQNAEKAGQADAQKQGQGKGDSKDSQLAKADQGRGQGEGKGQAQAKGKVQGEGKGQGQGKGKGQGEGKGQGQGEGKGQGKGQGEGEGQGDQDPGNQELADQPVSDHPEEMAQKEQQLSKEASELADKLQRLAGKDKRLGHNAGQNAHLAGQKIATAAQEVKQGHFGAAGVNGFQGELALRKVVAQLERVVKEKPDLTDVASEDAPKEYEALISEYFKKLSHAE
jgi:hypothetical protein